MKVDRNHLVKTWGSAHHLIVYYTPTIYCLLLHNYEIVVHWILESEPVDRNHYKNMEGALMHIPTNNSDPLTIA